MLLNFTLENWMSFMEPATFSMIASKERQHGVRLSKLPKYQTRVLPVAAVYGGNASGKTNLFKALAFVKRFVVHGTMPDSSIPIEPYRLGKEKIHQPTKFQIEMLIDDLIYELSFSATRKAVQKEKLVRITSANEYTLYERNGHDLILDPSLEKDQFLRFAFQGTRDNQLYLSNAVFQNVDVFKPVYDWFKDNLEMVAPDSRFSEVEQFIDTKNESYADMNQLLSLLDTGISHLGGENIPVDYLSSTLRIPMHIFADIKEDETVRLDISPTLDRYFVTRKNGELLAQKLVSFHGTADGKELKFEMGQESDGTRRVIDLLPAFLSMMDPSSKKVYVIDELDRSLHTMLTYQLLRWYLENRKPESRAQLLFTTHDLLLMDQDLLRRDEMWVAERAVDGRSLLRSFSEYQDIRYDKDIRKSYLQGRLGGVPRISNTPSLSCVREAE